MSIHAYTTQYIEMRVPIYNIINNVIKVYKHSMACVNGIMIRNIYEEFDAGYAQIIIIRRLHLISFKFLKRGTGSHVR